jgi:hypothetical protein
MTPEQFTYWLQGFSEISGKPPTKEQWEMIQKHLSTVFLNITAPTNFPNQWLPSPGLPSIAFC